MRGESAAYYAKRRDIRGGIDIRAMPARAEGKRAAYTSYARRDVSAYKRKHALMIRYVIAAKNNAHMAMKRAA